MSSIPLDKRVVDAAEAALAAQQYASAVDVLLGLGWLPEDRLEQWRRGRVSCLERVVQANLHKQSTAMRVLRRWASTRGLLARQTVYDTWTRDRRTLRFSVGGRPDIERAYRTHWVSPALSAAKRERMASRS